MGGFTTNTDKDTGALHKTLKVVNLEQKHRGHRLRYKKSHSPLQNPTVEGLLLKVEQSKSVPFEE